MQNDLGDLLKSLHAIDGVSKISSKCHSAVVAEQERLVILQEWRHRIGDVVGSWHAERNVSDAAQDDHGFREQVVGNRLAR